MITDHNMCTICNNLEGHGCQHSMVESIKEYVGLLVEKNIRETDISDGAKVKWGSSKHIKDLEKRIKDALFWRDKQKKGSESRANYSRLIGKLKNELKSAQRLLQKKK
jgi:hypothetical protein